MLAFHPVTISASQLPLDATFWHILFEHTETEEEHSDPDCSLPCHMHLCVCSFFLIPNSVTFSMAGSSTTSYLSEHLNYESITNRIFRPPKI